ncbi:MAG: hypothetical protein PHR68_02455 [Candidatus Gracilibacteria bacterium]|nr:hypothetical protein [Candidatus Gracilibacteria bacterium]
MLEKIKEISTSFFTNLSIDLENLEIVEQEKNIYYIKIKSSDSPILIGHSGDTLRDIKNILSMILNKTFEEKIVIHLEINDYMESKDNRLFDFVKNKIEFVEKTGKDIVLPFFSAYERKKIHSFVAELGNNKIYTKSSGEGKERRMHICKKDQKLTIDMNSIDI